MTAELKSTVAKLRALSPKVNAAAEQAARVVQSVEKFLNDECKAGLTCYVTIWTKCPEHDQYADEDDYEGIFLGFDRVGGKFRIVIQQNERSWNGAAEAYEVHKGVTPWSDSSRGDKLRTFNRLPTLLDRIAASMERSIASTDEAAATVADLLSALEPADSKQVELINPADNTFIATQDRLNTTLKATVGHWKNNQSQK